VLEFWNNVSPICSPHEARLTENIVSPHLLGVEQARQDKLRKKLDKQVELGEITEEMRDSRLNKLGRKTEKNKHDSDSFSILNLDRSNRKKQQVDNVAALIKLNDIESKKVVVDFGSGSGNLCLALASVYPSTTFVFVDQNTTSLGILRQRALEGNLTNIVVKSFQFTNENLEEFIHIISNDIGKIDLGIGLHSCGSFTDLVMEVCRLSKCDCLIVPCCNGKINPEQENYPRSKSLSSVITRSDYILLSRAADDLSNYEAKCVVELDRARWAEEVGAMSVSYHKMTPPTATPKHLMLYCSFAQYHK